MHSLRGVPVILHDDQDAGPNAGLIRAVYEVIRSIRNLRARCDSRGGLASVRQRPSRTARSVDRAVRGDCRLFMMSRWPACSRAIAVLLICSASTGGVIVPARTPVDQDIVQAVPAGYARADLRPKSGPEPVDFDRAMVQAYPRASPSFSWARCCDRARAKMHHHWRARSMEIADSVPGHSSPAEPIRWRYAAWPELMLVAVLLALSAMALTAMVISRRRRADDAQWSARAGHSARWPDHRRQPRVHCRGEAVVGVSTHRVPASNCRPWPMRCWSSWASRPARSLRPWPPSACATADIYPHRAEVLGETVGVA